MEQPASPAQPLSCTSKNSQIERLSDTLLLGVASRNPHGTGGCRTLVHASERCNNPHKSKGCQMRCRWEVSRLVEAPGISSRDVPAKTLTEQGAAVHMSKFLDVVTTLTHRSKGCQTRCCWEVSRLVEAPRICRDVPAKTLKEQRAAAHASTLLAK